MNHVVPLWVRLFRPTRLASLLFKSNAFSFLSAVPELANINAPKTNKPGIESTRPADRPLPLPLYPLPGVFQELLFAPGPELLPFQLSPLLRKSRSEERRV